MTPVLGALYERAWTSWARWRYRAAFDEVSAFCLFVGYPRSGHSLLGALLNAHRHAVIAHELQAPQLVLAGCDRETLYARILARAAWFDLRGNTSNYAYQVPNQWQGRFENLRVVGDKRGGSAALAIGEHPNLLNRLRVMVGVRLRLIHVVRNPFDNIAAISLWHRLPIEDAVEYYFRLCRIMEPLVAPDRDDALTVHHEELIRDPETMLARVCGFLGLESDAEYLAACGGITADTPSHTRLRVPWSTAHIDDVGRRAARFPFLSSYTFEIAVEEPASRGRRARERQPQLALWPRTVLRWFPTEARPSALAAAQEPSDGKPTR
jgi:hypothetical protein